MAQIGEQNQDSKPKSTKPAKVSFDREGFFISIGVGFQLHGTLTAQGGTTNSTGFTLYQRLEKQIPHSIQERIALILGVLFMLFGCPFTTWNQLVVQYLFVKLKSGNLS